MSEPELVTGSTALALQVDQMKEEMAATAVCLIQQLFTVARLAESMLRSAQTLRVQQVQACNDGAWGEKYKTIADIAWKRLNEAHKQIAAILGVPDSSEAPK